MNAADERSAALQRAVAGRYSLIGELGEGGMGVVFHARDVALERSVAIKLLREDVAGSHPLARDRFIAEARTAASLNHPNIVPIHLVEERAGLAYFVMAHVDGETLGQRVRRGGPLDSARVAGIIRDVAWALHYAHSRGVVHRDIKPDNILLDRESGRAVVTDFGIAGRREDEDATPADWVRVLGTPRYMSPEQAAGLPLDGRTDLYSLGLTAHFALTGESFDGDDDDAGVPAGGDVLRALIQRCLEYDPDARPAGAEHVATALTPATEKATPIAIRHVFNTARHLDATSALLAVFPFVLISVGKPSIAFAMMGALMAFALSRLLRSIAAASRAGYSELDVYRAFARLKRDVREELEFAVVRSEDSSDWESRARVVAPSIAAARTMRRREWRSGNIAFGGGLLTSAVSLTTPSASLTIALLALACFCGATILHGMALRTRKTEPEQEWRFRDYPGLGAGARLLGTRVTKYLFRLVRIFPANRPVVTAAGGATGYNPAEPTEVGLERDARRVFRALPRHFQERFADVPPLLERLGAEAERLRRGDPAALPPVLAALENLRLDLTRFESDLTLEDDLKLSLEEVREVARRMQAEREAVEEVRQLLRA